MPLALKPCALNHTDTSWLPFYYYIHTACTVLNPKPTYCTYIIHNYYTVVYTPAVSSSPELWEAGDHWLGTEGRCAGWTMGFIPACPLGAVHGRQYNKRYLQQCTLYTLHMSLLLSYCSALRDNVLHTEHCLIVTHKFFVNPSLFAGICLPV